MAVPAATTIRKDGRVNQRGRGRKRMESGRGLAAWGLGIYVRRIEEIGWTERWRKLGN